MFWLQCCNSVILADELCCHNERNFPCRCRVGHFKGCLSAPSAFTALAKMGRGGGMSIAIKNPELLHSLGAIEGCASKLGKCYNNNCNYY